MRDEGVLERFGATRSNNGNDRSKREGSGGLRLGTFDDAGTRGGLDGFCGDPTQLQNVANTQPTALQLLPTHVQQHTNNDEVMINTHLYRCFGAGHTRQVSSDRV